MEPDEPSEAVGAPGLTSDSSDSKCRAQRLDRRERQRQARGRDRERQEPGIILDALASPPSRRAEPDELSPRQLVALFEECGDALLSRFKSLLISMRAASAGVPAGAHAQGSAGPDTAAVIDDVPQVLLDSRPTRPSDASLPI